MIHPNHYVEKVVSKTTEALLSPTILHQISTMKKADLHTLFSQIYFLVEAFPGFLAGILLQTNDEAIRFAVIDNLVDECGGFEKLKAQDKRCTHSQLLKTFVEKLSPAATPQLGVQSAHTKVMLANFHQLFTHSSLIEVLGAMTAMESASSAWFEFLYQQLRDRDEFSREDLYFFELHTMMDEKHGDAFREVLMPLLTNSESYAFFSNGAMKAANISINFYLGLSEEISV